MLCADKSVSEWRGKDHNYEDGMPHVMKIASKPKGVGNEIKNVADCETGIMLVLELVEHKSMMQQKEHVKEFGAGTLFLM